MIDNHPVLVDVVADGHGGKDGSVIARAAVHEILKGVKAGQPLGKIFFEKLFLQIHQGLVEKKLKGGTALTVTLVDGKHLVLAYVGDVEAKIATRNGKLLLINKPHHLGGHAAETERIKKSGAKIFENRVLHDEGARLLVQKMLLPGATRNVGEIDLIPGLDMTRSLGDAEYDPHVLHTPEFVSHNLVDDDRFLLVASDGFWKTIEQNKAARYLAGILAGAKDAAAVRSKIAALLDECILVDNVTLEIVELHKKGE